MKRANCLCIFAFLLLTFFEQKVGLRHCATSRKVADSIPVGVYGIFHWRNSFGYGPGIDSSSNSSEYQEYFLGVKVAGA